MEKLALPADPQTPLEAYLKTTKQDIDMMKADPFRFALEAAGKLSYYLTPQTILDQVNDIHTKKLPISAGYSNIAGPRTKPYEFSDGSKSLWQAHSMPSFPCAVYMTTHFDACRFAAYGEKNRFKASRFLQIFESVISEQL